MLAPTNALSCCVCGSSDARTLTTTPLTSGALVVVCGSHATAHAREGRAARTGPELRALLKDRRARPDRRDPRTGDADELAQQLSAAFCGERRSDGRRRADAKVARPPGTSP